MWGKKRWLYSSSKLRTSKKSATYYSSRVPNFLKSKVICYKRGISPLIATVLLIAFAVALGAMIMNWSSNLLSESRMEDECSKVKISLVGKFCLKENQVTLGVLNSGESTVEEVLLRVSSKDLDNEIRIKESKLLVNQRFNKEFPFLKGQNSARYEIIPTIGPESQRIKCEAVAIKLDRLEDC